MGSLPPSPQILVDTRALQKEINALVGKLERTFSVTDELLFKVWGLWGGPEGFWGVLKGFGGPERVLGVLKGFWGGPGGFWGVLKGLWGVLEGCGGCGEGIWGAL